MIKTGSSDLDNLIEGFNEEITYIYGEPGSGKTTICKLASISLLKENKKVIFIDTENGFSVDRFKQLSNNNLNLLENIIVVKIKNFDDQCDKINEIKNIKKVNLIIVDSLGKFYRTEVKRNPKETNNKLASCLTNLREITKNNIPVIITNQVYSDIEKNEIVPVGGEMVKKFCQKIIELKNNPRKVLLIKPEKKFLFFKMTDIGIEKI